MHRPLRDVKQYTLLVRHLLLLAYSTYSIFLPLWCFQALPPVPPTALWFASKAEELERRGAPGGVDDLVGLRCFALQIGITSPLLLVAIWY